MACIQTFLLRELLCHVCDNMSCSTCLQLIAECDDKRAKKIDRKKRSSLNSAESFFSKCCRNVYLPVILSFCLPECLCLCLLYFNPPSSSHTPL